MSSVGPVKDYVSVFNQLYEVVPGSFGAWDDLVCEMDDSKVVRVGELRGFDATGLTLWITAVGMGSGRCVQDIYENEVLVARIHQLYSAEERVATVPKERVCLLRLYTGADIQWSQ